MTNHDSKTQQACENEADVYVVEAPGGFTESFDRRTIETLEALRLIRHVRDGHVLEDGAGRGVGPLHRFYGPAS